MNNLKGNIENELDTATAFPSNREREGVDIRFKLLIVPTSCIRNMSQYPALLHLKTRR